MIAPNPTPTQSTPEVTSTNTSSALAFAKNFGRTAAVMAANAACVTVGVVAAAWILGRLQGGSSSGNTTTTQ